MRILLSVILASLGLSVLLFSAQPIQGQYTSPKVIAVVERFHKLFNSDRYEELNSMRSRDFRKKIDRVFFLGSLTDFLSLSGKAISFRVKKTEAIPTGRITYIKVETQFENATVHEEFMIVTNKGRFEISSYDHGAIASDADVTRNRAIWDGKNISNYDFQISNVNSGFTSVYAPVHAVVKDGTPISVTLLDPQDRRKITVYDSVNSVEKMFDYIRSERAHNNRVRVKYDPTFGFPLQIDSVSRDSNGWGSFTIEKFQKK